MKCCDIKEYLYRFLDKELDDEKIKRIQEHLDECPLCSMEVDKEKRIDCLVREHFPKEEAPYQLKEAILEKVRQQHKKRFRPFQALVPAFVVAILFVSLFGIHLYLSERLFMKAIATHATLKQEGFTFGLRSSNPQEVADWLQEKVEFNVAVPDLSAQGAKLVGGGITLVEQNPAVWVVYEKKGSQVSFFMFEQARLELPRIKRIVLDDRSFYLGTYKGYNSVSWAEKGITCVVVSSLDETELLQLASW